jgi:hypothetical protein
MSKSQPIAPETLAAVTAAVQQARRAGCPVASTDPSCAEEIARVVIRRWRSSGRRGVDPSDHAARLRDLVKGFVEQFEPDPKMVGGMIREWEFLAEETVKAL